MKNMFLENLNPFKEKSFSQRTDQIASSFHRELNYHTVEEQSESLVKLRDRLIESRKSEIEKTEKYLYSLKNDLERIQDVELQS